MDFLALPGLANLVTKIKAMIGSHNTSSIAHANIISSMENELAAQKLLVTALNNSILSMVKDIEDIKKFNGLVSFVSPED